jgi:CheY-like chemotaxis protein
MEPRTEQPAPNSVLVVDEDPKSLRILEVSLRSEGFEVQVAADASTASAWLEKNVPGLVIAATALAGVDGFEFCRRMKAQPDRSNVPFMLMGDPTAANRIRGIEIGAEDFVGKPVFVKDVVGRVSLLLQRQKRRRMETDAAGDKGFSGTLADVSVVDLIQTLQGHSRSGVIHLHSPQSGTGEIYFRQGAVVDAEAGRLSGREAMFRLFSWSQGTYRIEPKSIRRKDAIGLPPTALVMEGMRRLDEWQRLLKDLPSLQTVFEVDYRVLAERLAEIPDEVNGLLRLFDGTRTLLNVVDDGGIGDGEALSLAGKLYAEGIIRDVQAPAEPTAAAEPAAEGWLTEAAGPFRPPAAADEAEASAPDGDIHRRRTGPMEPLEGAAPEAARHDTPIDLVPPPDSDDFAAATAGGPAVAAEPPSDVAEQTLVQKVLSEDDSRDEAPNEDQGPDETSQETSDDPMLRSQDPMLAQTLRPAPSSSAIPDRREDESAVVIPFADSPSGVRRTLLAAGGVPNAAPSVESDTPEGPIETTDDKPSAASRSTEPGIGPAAEDPADPLVDEEAVQALLAAAEPLPARLPVTERPFSASATNWMRDGDAVSPSEALDELALPSRHRGPIMLIGAAALLVAIFFGAQKWMGRPQSGKEPARPAVTSPPAPSVAEALPKAAPAATPTSTAAVSPPTPAAAAVAAVAPVAGEQAGEHAPAPPAVDLPVAPAAKTTPSSAPPASSAPPSPPAVAAVAPSKPLPAPGAKAAAAVGDADRDANFPKLLEKCREAFNQGKMREATTVCSAAKDANTESGDALLLLAHAEFNRNHLKEALQWAEKAIKADPNLAEAYVIFGGVQQDAGKNREAKWAYKKYLELAPRGQYAADLRAIVDTL